MKLSRMGLSQYGMDLRELNLPLLKQQIKYFIGLSDIKAEFL
jgi:hypothetical protein